MSAIPCPASFPTTPKSAKPPVEDRRPYSVSTFKQDPGRIRTEVVVGEMADRSLSMSSKPGPYIVHGVGTGHDFN